MNTILIAKSGCQPSKPAPLRFTMLTVGAVLVLISGATTSCNTTRGFGRDVEKTGDKIQDASVR